MSNSSDIPNLSIEELRRLYDFEVDRTGSIESKASAVLGFATLVTTILTFMLKLFIESKDKIPGLKPELTIYALFNTASIIIIVASLIYLIKALKIRAFLTPFKTYDVDKLKSQLIKPSEELEPEIRARYRNILPQLYKENNKKACSLNKSIKLLVAGILLSVVSPLLMLWYKIWSG